MKVHITKDGRHIPFCDLTDEHIENILRYMERQAMNGVLVQTPLFDSQDCEWDEVRLYGRDALEYLGYHHYIEERRKRKWTSTS